MRSDGLGKRLVTFMHPNTVASERQTDGCTRVIMRSLLRRRNYNAVNTACFQLGPSAMPRHHQTYFCSIASRASSL